MEPRIQYIRTVDGVSIAFWTLGDGIPLVLMPPLPWSHIQLEWQDLDYRRWYERLAGNKRLVRYDSRGSGLSQRTVTDYSLDSLVLDLEAVVDRLGLERFALAGVIFSGPVAIAYAALHPENVSHLFLWCTHAQTSALQSPQVRTLRGLREDWEFFTETVAHGLVAGWTAGEQAHRFATLMRESATPQILEAMPGLDVTGLLPRVQAPTLVLHRRQASFPDTELVKDLVSKIPDARLVLLEGASLLPFVGDMESVVRAVDEFLGLEMPEVLELADVRLTGGPVTILFTDVEGSTSLTQRLGDAKAREILQEHERILREALRAYGGSEVKSMGDGFMVSFPSATRALECAVAIQRACAQHNETAEEPVRMRIGVNAGEPIAEAKDLFGTAVITAARIASQARGGEILVANVVRELAAGKGFLFADRGEVTLKGFEEPVRLYEVRWEGQFSGRHGLRAGG
jgi:class 3 adenylate cyclase